jgi:hypothetical protein
MHMKWRVRCTTWGVMHRTQASEKLFCQLAQGLFLVERSRGNETVKVVPWRSDSQEILP